MISPYFLVKEKPNSKGMMSEYDSSKAMSHDDVNAPDPTTRSVEEGTVDGYSVSSNGKGGGDSGGVSSLWKSLSMGGTVFDGFLLAASQEVGQSILTLPNVFSKVGFAWGIILELVFATMALYTNFLLVSMHAQYRHKLQVTNDKRHHDKHYIASYHEILESLVGPWLKKFSVTVVFFALLGLSTVQIIATASNFYILSDAVSKRTWALIWGSLFSLIAFVPTFRHYRMLSVLGILTTTYVANYMTIQAAMEGPKEDVVYNAPESVEGFFTGFVQLLFVYGGHTSNIEVADVMDSPGNYDKSYFWSYLYVFSLTMPNAVTAYHTYGQEASYNANSFNLFPRSFARDLGIVMMSLHQAVAFGLFAGPLFHMWEKLIRIHDKPFKVRALARLPLCAFMLFLAVAFPFFGAINAVLGAFTTSFGTYIIPCVGYNLAFSSDDTSGMVKKPFLSMQWMRRINWVVAGFVVAGGVGAGGYTSIKNFLRQIENFDYFAECYQC
ncbi:Auxin transporter-like protein [Seminavis robusta]|uniref:Auxin transporter-like protein n=1 Tax=Seminavis robusta TaxID=568900 RepID=A0A9N8E6A8_9STRA|nr:Auxin transporter-like protein [Seminavis robusta]|eukprot:Sro708_g190710.1 Auxin transporter-like protein (496) ;mRNA; f:20562-22049